MTEPFTFRVYGVPRPQGSVTPMISKSTGKLFVKGKPSLAQWRNSVVQAAIERRAELAGVTDWEVSDEAIGGGFPAGPVRVELAFWFSRPSGHSAKRTAEDGGIKYNGPDIDKLARGVCDALTIAGVIGDDRQVAELSAIKRFTMNGDPGGADVSVIQMAGGWLNTRGDYVS